MEAAGRTDAEIAADVPHVLELVDLGHKIWNFPRETFRRRAPESGYSQSHRHPAYIIIADEPTGNLDPANTFEIVRIFEEDK